MASSSAGYQQRSHTCGELRESSVGAKVALNGWVDRVRDHNHFAFLDLRDRYGITQVFACNDSGDLLQTIQGLRNEDVVAVEGTVRLRPESNINQERPTGRIEVVASRLVVLNRSKTPPFEIQGDQKVSEDIRLRYRYIDLRRPRMQRNLIFRNQFFLAVRKKMTELQFVEIETPMLTRAVPEGARDYLVPSRLSPGAFYALPQSPQLFKQLLMVAGIDRYFQVARCLRDEDLRADRQPEFTQLDLEMSFPTEERIFEVVEAVLAAAIEETMAISIERPFPRLKHQEVMHAFGSEKPDLRHGLRIVDVTALAGETEFQVFRSAIAAGGVVRCLPVPGAGVLSRKEIEELEKRVKELGAKGLAWAKVEEGGKASGGIGRFLESGAGRRIVEETRASAGTLLLFGADRPAVVCAALSEVMKQLAGRFGNRDENRLAFCWLVEFPLFEWSEEDKAFVAAQHPFTTPVEDYEGQMSKDPGNVRARAYDLVLNGWELGSGGIRIHDRPLQTRVFEVLGISPEQARNRFGFLLEAFEYGAPPHGGIGIGLDRVIALLLKEDNIREVLAFPKTASAACLMTGAPAPVEDRQWRDLHIRPFERAEGDTHG